MRDNAIPPGTSASDPYFLDLESLTVLPLACDLFPMVAKIIQIQPERPVFLQLYDLPHLAITCETGHFLGFRSRPARPDKTLVEWKLRHTRDRKPCSIAMRRINQPVSGTGNNGTWHT